MPRRLPFTLFSAMAWGILVNAAPADPTITTAAVLPRQLNADFIGWLEVNSTWYSQSCDEGLTWYQSGEYAQCCPETVTACNAPTACVAGSQIYPLPKLSTTITTACTGNYNNTAYSICNTVFIFESFGDSDPKTDIVCGDSSVNWSYYRKVPATATEIKSSSTPSSSPSPGSLVSSLPSPSNSPEPEKSESKAWIAGAVVGPIVGIALIAGVVFLLMRRKKNKNTLPQTGGATMGPPPGVSQPYTDAKPQLGDGSAYGQASSPGYNPNDPYNQQAYGQQPQSPAPQYTQPYDTPGSPPQGVYAPEKQEYYAAPSQPDAAELGGSSNPGPAAEQSHTAELSGEQVKK